MEKRIKEIGGILEIQNDKGVLIKLEVPINR
jgi:signal transduction histidine kinase